jgi:hypothetical protein
MVCAEKGCDLSLVDFIARNDSLPAAFKPIYIRVSFLQVLLTYATTNTFTPAALFALITEH